MCSGFRKSCKWLYYRLNSTSRHHIPCCWSLRPRCIHIIMQTLCRLTCTTMFFSKFPMSMDEEAANRAMHGDHQHQDEVFPVFEGWGGGNDQDQTFLL